MLKKVFDSLKDRCGRLRIVRGRHQGDAAEMAVLELVDRPARCEADAEAAPAQKSEESKEQSDD